MAIPETRSITSPSIICRAPGDYSPWGQDAFQAGIRHLDRAIAHEKDRTQNKVIGTPGDACAEERQGGEQSKVARLGVHSRSGLERGSDQAAPPLCAS